MALASLADINVHLPQDKIDVDGAQYASLQLDAERIVRGWLSGYVDAAILSSWSEPDLTPDIIRAAAGRFVAAFRYRERYSEDSLDDPEYAQNKYNEAMAIIMGIRDGNVLIPDVDVSGGDHMEEGDFYPDGTDSVPIFRIRDRDQFRSFLFHE